MIKKKSFHSAFTLIELLVVITIIGILAGIALPVFNSVQIKGSQTKALAQAKQIGLALRLFASDNDGSYPTTGIPTNLAPANANIAYSTLFPTYVQNEVIFYNKLARGFAAATAPDNRLDPAGQYDNALTLAAGENVYAYVSGLKDSDNSTYPLVADSFLAANNGTYAAPGAVGAGSVWNGSKAVVIRLDNSGAVENVDGATHTVLGNTGLAAKANIFAVVAGAWLDGAVVLNAKPAAGAAANP